ncbi:ABC transporter ATP-binding protein/permease [uncultured Thomasclavelia sp.]|uniref:ABC transporter ATP-binding protein/permease n=1 Tax=uncultured Thomasclavelia sp. TaxID=3025759 RepID=UPI0025FDC414|nr:ABC transporter ATP-binding protein/permease [uncultured Thomasclavelia sp.]
MLQIKKICKQYKTGNLIQKALDGVSLNLRDNEFVAILGPSGSGKTTLLNIIGGLDRYDSGDLIINGISTKKYKDRDWDSYRNHTIGFVFQSYNLIPHQTVLSNVELALTISGVSKSERRQRAKRALEQVGLGNQGHKKPSQMSGGQMQRVAIARALVNDPDILLADEPTGALDSETSIQVMDLLKEVAKDRLVVMVTHNPDLAKQYATRIVELKDGVILSDSNPFKVDEKYKKAKHQNMGKSSMSLLTSLSLSFNNLKTKKARTILTSFAGSIGIIGIALILSLSNGVNQYIQSIEKDTLSEYPLQIQSSGFDLSAMLDAGGNGDDKEEGEVEVYQMLTNMFSRVGSNDLASLKQYLDSGDSKIENYTKSVEYTYNIAPQIYSSDSSNVRQVHPDQSFASLGIGSSSSSNSMMSSMMSTDVFYQMPSDDELYKDQYEVKAGHWPKNYNECVLVLTQNGNISDFMLYTLGLRDYSELENMITQFSKEETVTVPDDIQAYSYDDIIGINFKLVSAADYYQYDQQYNVYRDKTDDSAYMQQLIDNGEDLKIVGIVQPVDGATATMLQSGISYLPDLTNHVIDQATNSEIVQKQLANPDIDVFTGRSFDDTSSSQIDMSSLFTVDADILRSAFNIDQSKLAMDPSSLNLDLSQIQLDTSSLPAIDTDSLLSNINVTLSPEQIQNLSQSILTDFQNYLADNNLSDPTKMNEYFQAYLQTEQANTLIQATMANFLQESGFVEQFSANLQAQMQTIMSQYSATLANSLQQQITAAINQQMSNMVSSFQDAITIDTSKFAQAIKMNMNESELTELMMSLMTSETSSYENNLANLQYVDFDQPSSINIYPIDFESKQEVINILDQYNANMEKVDEDKVITYTDYVGTLMSSVTDIINVISYVLIAFVAISLVVSSIMIGVITYISVLERKKEIGILRAIGASKRNISQVFNAETFIIGLFAGLLGIVVTLLLLIPSNIVIHDIAGTTAVSASLPVAGGVILVALSVVLTLIGGLIPAKKAALEDPVTALRTE